MFDYTRITVQPPEGWATLKEFFEDTDGSKCNMSITYAKYLIGVLKSQLLVAAARQQALISQLDDHYLNRVEFRQKMKEITN